MYIILLNVGLFQFSYSQKVDFDEARFWESFYRNDWKNCAAMSKRISVQQGYPALYRAAAYSHLMLANYTSSAGLYRKALHLNSYDTLSLLSAAWNINQLNEPLMSEVYAKRLDASQQSRAEISAPRFLNSADAELSLKFPDVPERSTGTYFRLGWVAKPAHSWLWTNHISLYRQKAEVGYQVKPFPPPPGQPPPPDFITIYDTINISQRQWHSNLRFAPSSSWELSLPFNLLGTKINDTGIRGMSYGLISHYRWGDFKLTLGAQWLRFNDTTWFQPALAVTHFPQHNLNLYYGFKSGLIQQGSKGVMVHQIFAGTRVGSKAWIEGFFLSGLYRNYLDDAGAYVYNTFDSGKWRAGLSLKFRLKGHLQPQFHFSLDQLRLYSSGNLYLQRTLTTTLTWKH